jgi:hypothetical protein
MITGSATLRAVRIIGAHEGIDADDIAGVGVIDCRFLPPYGVPYRDAVVAHCRPRRRCARLELSIQQPQEEHTLWGLWTSSKGNEKASHSA